MLRVVAIAGAIVLAVACVAEELPPGSTPTPPRETPNPSPTREPTPPEPTLVVAPAQTATPTAYPAHYELPDLVTLPPEDIFIRPNDVTGEPELRFTSSVANLGLGPLILVGTYDETADATHAVQHIRTTSGDVVERPVGHFVFHPGHAHWHFERFNQFELWTYTEDGELLDVVSSGGKDSWCVTETGDLYEPLPEVYDPEPLLAGCDPEMQAIATGWIDTYDWDLPGQQLDLSTVHDGRYAFVSTVNPDGLILELESANNTLIVYLEIAGDDVTVLDEP